MAEVIDSFLISLGFDVDDESVKDADSSINSIKGNALKMGFALSGALVAAGLVAKATSKDIGELYNQSKLLSNVGVSELDAYRSVYERLVQSGEEFAPFVSNLDDLLANFKLKGEGPFEDLQIAEFPADFLTDAKNGLDLFERLLLIYDKLSDSQKRLADSSLGINDSSKLVLLEGNDKVQNLKREAEILGVITEQAAKDAEELNRSFSTLGESITKLKRVFTSKVSEDMEDFNTGLADVLAGMSFTFDGQPVPESIQKKSDEAFDNAGSSFLNYLRSLEKSPGLREQSDSPALFKFPSLRDFRENKRDEVIMNNRSVPPATVIKQTNNIKVDGSKSPGVTAKEVMKELNKQAAIAERGMRTGLLG